MVKHEIQSLEHKFTKFCDAYYPNHFNLTSPIRKKDTYYFSYLDDQDSEYLLAFKMMAMHGLKKKTETLELVSKYKKLNLKEQSFLAYNLSHEFKIATLAASQAIENSNSNVYEIGQCFGFSSMHYSHLIKEKGFHKKPISKLTAIEIKEEFVEASINMKRMTGDYTGDINYIRKDGIIYINNNAIKNDIVLSSIAEPFVLDGLIDILSSISITLVISYSMNSNNKVNEMRGNYFENCIDPISYDVYPFLDAAYNKKISWLTGLTGLIAIPK